VKLIIQPNDGLAPLLKAIRNARKSIDLVVFRFDRVELERALAAAVARGVPVRALIAHTNSGGQKRLRKLELNLLEAGVTVARTADDLPRYHGKMTIIDDTLYVLGFNYTKQDIEKSRSFGIITREKKLVREAAALFEADCTRQPYAASTDRLVVSPETSRELLSEFVKGARRQLLIYDERITDSLMLRLLKERAAAGVEIRVIGKVNKDLDGLATRKLLDMRLHVRALIRDGTSAFIGSQSLRKLELDARREIGVLLNDARIAHKMLAVFEADWEQAKGDKTPEPAAPGRVSKASAKGDKGDRRRARRSGKGKSRASAAA
jgi:phosphatidylserine/phosphatidylglycerophosphate/cardiolipin synthase-like enzyme